MSRKIQLPQVCLVLLCLPVLASAKGTESGQCGWYERAEGESTASGEPFNSTALTASHHTLHFGTLVRLIVGFRQLVVRVNDRPSKDTEQVLQLTLGAGEQLGLGRHRLREHFCLLDRSRQCCITD